MNEPQTKAHLEHFPKQLQIFLFCCTCVLFLLPAFSSNFYQEMVMRIMILAIFAMSLDLLQGVTGLVSLGHAAYFGLAGYVLAFLTPPDQAISLWWSLPLAVLVSAFGALVIGFFVVRTHGIYFIMVTIAFAQMVYFLFFDNKILGGSDGLYINHKPSTVIFTSSHSASDTPLGLASAGNTLGSSWMPFDLTNKNHFYYFVLFLMLLVYVGLRRFLQTPWGRTLAGIRVNEHRMRAIGYNTFGYKLGAFTAAGALAGLAGYLHGAQSGFVNPELMGFHLSASAIMMLILGGMGNFAGAIVGAFSFELLLHFLKDLPFGMGKHWQLWIGILIVLLILFARRGLLGLWERKHD